MKTATLLAIALATASTVAAAESPERQPQLLLSPANAIVGAWEFHARLFVCANGQTLQNIRASSVFNAASSPAPACPTPPRPRPFPTRR